MVALTEYSDIPYSRNGLFTMGNSQERRVDVLVTGSRVVDSYLIANVKKFVRYLDISRYTFLCGGAIGTDSIFAYEIARIGGEVTLYVPYILERHLQLSRKFPNVKIVQTEADGACFHKGMMLARNRRMVLISDVVLFFKGTMRGGSIYTARFAASKGVQVYVESRVPKLSKEYSGNRWLLESGCRKLSEFS